MGVSLNRQPSLMSQWWYNNSVVLPTRSVLCQSMNAQPIVDPINKSSPIISGQYNMESPYLTVQSSPTLGDVVIWVRIITYPYSTRCSILLPWLNAHKSQSVTHLIIHFSLFKTRNISIFQSIQGFKSFSYHKVYSSIHSFSISILMWQLTHLIRA